MHVRARVPFHGGMIAPQYHISRSLSSPVAWVVELELAREAEAGTPQLSLLQDSLTNSVVRVSIDRE